MPSSIEYLVSCQHASGGWGYTPGHRPVVEPTALALLAIRDEPGAEESLKQGVDWLLSCQHADGGWGINQDDPESGWQSVWALIALKVINQSGVFINRAVDWLASVGTSQINHEDFLKPEEISNADPGALSWPWMPGQICWIEPTALAVLALTDQKPSPLATRRIKAAREYFRRNRTPGGGWDIGNAGPLDTVVLPRAYPTALVMLALSRTANEDLQTIDVDALHQDLERDPSILAHSAGASALQAVGEDVKSVLEYITARQRSDGSWDNNPFFTAWATLAIKGYIKWSAGK